MAQLLLLEPQKALRESLTLNLVTTGGFTVITQANQRTDKNPEGLNAVVINHSLFTKQPYQEPANCPVIVYKTPSSNINDPCSFSCETDNHFSLTFSMFSLPAVASAIWQIIHTH